MNHSRKMFLVPEEFVKAMENRNNIQTAPQVQGLMHIKQEMDEVLADETLPVEIKTQKFDQMLQRYLTLQSQKEKFVPTGRIRPSEDRKPSNTNWEASVILGRLILF